ncbi:hypothetical protein [Streptomyces sp. NPDC051993]|uniref:hypothetical protein n=1 Tax=Streptomyces sp. NPDC051993 TaxID=3155286 RepID=UPI003424E433
MTTHSLRALPGQLLDHLTIGIFYALSWPGKFTVTAGIIGAALAISPDRVAGLVEHRTAIIIILGLLAAADVSACYLFPSTTEELRRMDMVVTDLREQLFAAGADAETHTEEANRWFDLYATEAKRADDADARVDELTAQWHHLHDELAQVQGRLESQDFELTAHTIVRGQLRRALADNDDTTSLRGRLAVQAVEHIVEHAREHGVDDLPLVRLWSSLILRTPAADAAGTTSTKEIQK